MLAAAQHAADLLAADGVSVTVWDPRVAKPLDPEMLADAARHKLVVSIEDGLRDGGIGSSIATTLETTEVRVLGVPTAYLPHGKADDILATLGLDGPGVAASVRAALAE